VAEYIVPLLLAVTAIAALRRRENAYDILTDGAKEGFSMLLTIAPALIVLLGAVGMLRSSGALEAFSAALSPALEFLGIPAETVLLLLIRPLSGSAALAVGAELMAAHGPDSLIGRTAAVMLGSTETTFYTVSVYFGACGVKKTRYAIPAALIADFMGFLAASWSVRMFFS
jgi:spore maturation protein B